jgi:hypothetical protein
MGQNLPKYGALLELPQASVALSLSKSRPREGHTYVCAKIAYLRGRKSQYSYLFIAISIFEAAGDFFEIFLFTYSIFGA